jgi:hypothetical protein
MALLQAKRSEANRGVLPTHESAATGSLGRCTSHKMGEGEGEKPRGGKCSGEEGGHEDGGGGCCRSGGKPLNDPTE